ncbi:hypothetical protein WME94_05010 [Sorangium sp. So ce429]
MSAPEVLSLRAPLANRARSYIVGRDPIEAWDEARMRELGLGPQRIDASSCRADPRGLARIRSGRRAAPPLSREGRGSAAMRPRPSPYDSSIGL